MLSANHLSNLDPWPLGLAVWPAPIRFMAKAEIFDHKLLGPFVAAQGAFPVRRGERDSGALEKAIEFVRNGEVVVMFPEGTRRGKPGHVPKHHTGAARVALEAGVPLVPAAIAGTDRLTRLGRQSVLYGQRRGARRSARRGLARGLLEATRRLMADIHALEAELARQ